VKLIPLQREMGCLLRPWSSLLFSVSGE
jgi:hypothetical protein